MNAQGKRKVVMVAVASVVTIGAVSSYALAATDNSASSNTQSSRQESESVETLPEPGDQQKPKSDKAQRSTNTGDTTVTVNGQPVEVPENGTYSETTQDGNSRTDVKVESSNNSTSTGSSSSNSSSVKLNVTTESRSSSSE